MSLVLASLALNAEPNDAALTTPAGPPPEIQISPEEFETALRENILMVEEFKFIREQADRLGLTVYLFGGTAAGFGHYVRWNLLRKKGDSRFQPDRFTDGYENIYRSTQDADLVVDGPAEKARELEALLHKKFPHLQGSKSAWEVRLLNEDTPNRESLLGKDFQRQHTDSNSTGLIRVTEVPKGESIVKDARFWNEARPPFFRDLLEGKISFYFSKEHLETKRSKEGRNPAILAVIRYLTKKYQYELKSRPEDEYVINQIIKETNFKTILDASRNVGWSYVSEWLEKNARKLYLHAVNLVYAKKDMDDRGLREKLVSLGNSHLEQSMPWWLNREPLPEFPLGSGSGDTAETLKITEVAHDTRTFLAFESITRSHLGFANAFISRDGVTGEAAVLGNGFYVREGKVGAVGSGITIRFKLNPKARLGTDFLRHGDYLVILNRNALELIPESMNISPKNLLMLYLDGGIKKFDEGQIFKLNRSVQSKDPASVTLDDFKEVLSLFKIDRAMQAPEALYPLLKKVFEAQLVKNRKELIELINAALNEAHPLNQKIISEIFTRVISETDTSILTEHPVLAHRLIFITQNFRTLYQAMIGKLGDLPAELKKEATSSLQKKLASESDLDFFKAVFSILKEGTASLNPQMIGSISQAFVRLLPMEYKDTGEYSRDQKAIRMLEQEKDLSWIANNPILQSSLAGFAEKAGAEFIKDASSMHLYYRLLRDHRNSLSAEIQQRYANLYMAHLDSIVAHPASLKDRYWYPFSNPFELLADADGLTVLRDLPKLTEGVLKLARKYPHIDDYSPYLKIAYRLLRGDAGSLPQHLIDRSTNILLARLHKETHRKPPSNVVRNPSHPEFLGKLLEEKDLGWVENNPTLIAGIRAMSSQSSDNLGRDLLIRLIELDHLRGDTVNAQANEHALGLSYEKFISEVLEARDRKDTGESTPWRRQEFRLATDFLSAHPARDPRIDGVAKESKAPWNHGTLKSYFRSPPKFTSPSEFILWLQGEKVPPVGLDLILAPKYGEARDRVWWDRVAFIREASQVWANSFEAFYLLKPTPEEIGAYIALGDHFAVLADPFEGKKWGRDEAAKRSVAEIPGPEILHIISESLALPVDLREARDKMIATADRLNSPAMPLTPLTKSERFTKALSNCISSIKTLLRIGGRS